MNKGQQRALKFSKLIAAEIPASHVSEETNMCTETGTSLREEGDAAEISDGLTV